MEKVNKKIEDFENGLITITMDKKTFVEKESSERQDNNNSGFSHALYQVSEFLKELKNADELTYKAFQDFSKDRYFEHNIYSFKECVLQLNRLFKDKK